jgi:hypothetical protein
VDERGIARLSYVRNREAHIMAMPVGRMELSGTPKLDGSCWEIMIHCTDGTWCGETGVAPNGSTAGGLPFFTNTQEQMRAIIDALGQIKPNFRDTTPDIRMIQ